MALLNQSTEAITKLQDSFQVLLTGVLSFIPKFLLALIIFVIGWIVGKILGRVIAQIIAAIKIDKALSNTGVDDVIAKAGFRLDTGKFLGTIVEWFVIVVFLVASVDVLGLTQVNEFLKNTVLGYLPNVIVAALILVIAAVVADFVQKLVSGSAKATSMPSAHFLGGIAKWAVWIFALIAALVQLGIAADLLNTLFTGLIAMLAIAGGIAFGLGGKEAASKYIDRLKSDIS